MQIQMPSNISTRLHYQHKSLIDLIDGLTDEQVRRQVNAGKWSIFENAVHLQTYQHLFVARVHQILEGNNPQFPRYSADADPQFLDNCSLSTREILQDLITTRKDMTSGMVQFPATDLVKIGEHPAFGKMNLLEWMNFFLLHEAHHLFVVFKMAAQLKKGI